MRLRLPVLVLATALLLSGCASGTVIDVPESAGSAAATATADSAMPTAEPSPSVAVALDCATALPATAVEDRVGLPSGTVTASVVDGECTYAIAGNPSAVVVSVAPGRLAETFTGDGEARGAVPVPLGMAAYWVAGEAPSSPSELAVLAGGRELRIVSFVGDQGALVEWAVAVLESLGVDLAVA